MLPELFGRLLVVRDRVGRVRVLVEEAASQLLAEALGLV